MLIVFLLIIDNNFVSNRKNFYSVVFGSNITHRISAGCMGGKNISISYLNSNYI